jgi:acetyl-CoA C-acetyltransferase
MVAAARAAAEDAGAIRLLQQVDWIGVVGGLWSYRNPGQLIADLIGAPDARTALSGISGTAPVELLGVAAERIWRGEIEVALIVGGEARWSHQRLKRDGVEPTWLRTPGTGQVERLATLPNEMLAEFHLLGRAANAYALFDDSRRAELGETMVAHRTRIADLWSRFSEVAVGHPFAWDRTPHTATEIAEATDRNRMIAFPYTKSMVANNTVDMASAVIVCSVEAAHAAGIAADRLVFPHVVSHSHETWQVINRHELHRSSALEAAGRASFEHAGIAPSDIAHLDLYACFPSIVQTSAEALRFDPDRQLTVTGGLGFAGAPMANSAGQSMVAMIPLLRDGGWGLIHSNGGNATKHAVMICSNVPPTQFACIDAQQRADLRPRQAVTEGWQGSVTVEAATVVFDRDGPTNLLAAVLTADGERGWATSTDASVINETMSEGLAGRAVRRSADGVLAT